MLPATVIIYTQKLYAILAQEILLSFVGGRWRSLAVVVGQYLLSHLRKLLTHAS